MGLVLLAVALCCGAAARGQGFVKVEVPEALCAGDTARVTFGFDEERSVVIELETGSQSVSEEIFLPDGIDCGEMGCSYRSHVTFEGFSDDSTVTSAEDILFVRIKMEHSYIGDLYINITCPNGQKADILRFSNFSSSSLLSSCLNGIPSGSRGWEGPSTSNNRRAYLGYPSHNDNIQNLCNSSLNPAGQGRDYCWSNNTTAGIGYAGSGGHVYRTANQTYVETTEGGADYYRVNPSNMSDSSNFFHPDESFGSLVGCPLNGEWYVEVIDGVRQDNGYIFEWELAFDESILNATACPVEGYSITGEGVTMVDDSTFTIVAPERTTGDTVINYTYTVQTTCGIIDTTVALAVHATYMVNDTAEACDELAWKDYTFTSDTMVSTTLHTRESCDSMVNTLILIHPSYHDSAEATIVENDLPFTFLGNIFDSAVEDTLLTDTTVYGCDSTVRLTLVVYPNVRSDTAVTLCPEETPFEWNGLSLSATTDTSVTMLTTQGADSVVTLHLTILPRQETHFWDSICNGLSYSFGDTLYSTAGTYQYSLPDANGCDSANILHLSMLGNNLRARINAIPMIVTLGNPEFTLHDASANAATRQWILPDGTYSEHDLQRTFPDDGSDTFAVVLVAYTFEGCTDTARTHILMDRTAMFTPNAFTPNLTENNRWQPVGNQVGEMEIWIYSRQGLLVAHLKGVDAAWDGNAPDGTPCPQGAYVFHLRYRTTIRPEQVKNETGTILLIR